MFCRYWNPYHVEELNCVLTTTARRPQSSWNQKADDWLQITAVHFSRSVVSGTLRPGGLQHAWPPCQTQTPAITQTHVHWVGDAIQPSHPLSSPSPSAFDLSQHQGLFKRISSSHQITSSPTNQKNVHKLITLTHPIFKNFSLKYIGDFNYFGP